MPKGFQKTPQSPAVTAPLQGRQGVWFVIKTYDENEANEADIDINKKKEIKKETEKEKNKKNFAWAQANSPVAASLKKRRIGAENFWHLRPYGRKMRGIMELKELFEHEYAHGVVLDGRL